MSYRKKLRKATESSTLANLNLGTQAGANYGKLFQMLQNMPSSELTGSDYSHIKGQLQGTSQAAANQSISQVGRNLGTNSPLYNMLASNIQGGAAADVSGKLADIGIDEKQRSFQNAMARAGLLAQITTGASNASLQQQGMNTTQGNYQTNRRDKVISDAGGPQERTPFGELYSDVDWKRKARGGIYGW